MARDIANAPRLLSDREHRRSVVEQLVDRHIQGRVEEVNRYHFAEECGEYTKRLGKTKETVRPRP
jgi:hypothetical protein